MILDDLASYLQTAGVGTVGSDIFKGGLPTESALAAPPDALVALTEVPGLSSVHSLAGGAASYQQPVIQILVRAAAYGYESGRQRAENAYVALDGVANRVIGDHFYLWIVALRSPWKILTDDYNRPVIAFDIRCAVRTV